MKIEPMTKDWDGNEMWSRAMEPNRLKVIRI